MVTTEQLLGAFTYASGPDRESNLDRDLIAAALQGDEAAFSKIYVCYRDRIYNYAYRMLGKQSVAEDMTHEAFLALIQHPDRYQPERSSLLTYLCAIVRHHVFNYLRRWENQLAEPVDLTPDFAEQNNPKPEDPLANLLRSELEAKIEDTIAALPPLHREVILLREFEGFSYEEIALVIGSDLNVVKVRLHRARQTMAKQLASYLITDGESCHELR